MILKDQTFPDRDPHELLCKLGASAAANWVIPTRSVRVVDPALGCGRKLDVVAAGAEHSDVIDPGDVGTESEKVAERLVTILTVLSRKVLFFLLTLATGHNRKYFLPEFLGSKPGWIRFHGWCSHRS